MNKVFTCLCCGYIFVADEKTDKCIDCAKEIRDANADEINELNLRSKKGKVYVQVAFGDPYSTPCWYEDEKRECKVKDFVDVPYGMQIKFGQGIQVIHCLEEEKPYNGRIKRIIGLCD